MDLQLTLEQQQIIESAEAFLATASSMAQVRAHTQSLAPMDPTLWTAIARTNGATLGMRAIF
jgi:hypothetical protein